MNVAFGDTFYFLALINPRDSYHARAVEFAGEWDGTVVTTRWVLAEVCDGLCSGVNRELAVTLMTRLEGSKRFKILAGSDSLFERGFALFRDRADKDWSLTDCISFVAMADEGLRDALTGDRHFEQAGFTALLR